VTVAQAGSRPARQPVADERGASSPLPAEHRDKAKRRRRGAADARPPRANADMDRWTRPERGHGEHPSKFVLRGDRSIDRCGFFFYIYMSVGLPVCTTT
jgi:hypothetical protein